MNRTIWMRALLVILAIAFSTAAFAQYDESDTSKFSAFIGLYQPSGATLRNGGDSLWKTFGVGYSLKMDAAGRPKSYVAVEYSGSQGDHFTGKRTSLTYMQMFRPKPKSEEDVRGFYLGAGVSANLVQEKLDAQDFVMPPIPGEDNSGTQFGVTVVGGYDFGSSFFVEGRYTKMSELAKDADFSGLSVFLGSRSLF